MKLQSKHAPCDPYVRMLRKNSRETLLFSMIFAAIFLGLAIAFFALSPDGLIRGIGAVSWIIGLSLLCIGLVESAKLKRRAKNVEAQRNTRFY